MRMFGKAVIGGALLLTMVAPAIWADGGGGAKNTVSWETIIGIIQAGNPVGGIPGGGQPWSTLGGHAYVDLANSVVAFKVKGSCSPAAIRSAHLGRLPWSRGHWSATPRSASPTIIDTSSVLLDAQGNASFYGSVSPMTAGCSTSAVAFLIRSANDHWIANGAVQVPFP